MAPISSCIPKNDSQLRDLDHPSAGPVVRQQHSIVIAACSLIFGFQISFLPLTSVAQEVVPGEYMVKLKGQPSAQTTQQFAGRMKGKVSFKNSLGKMNMHHMAIKDSYDLDAVKSDPDVEYVEPNFVIRRYQTQENAGVLKSYSIEEIQDARGGEEAQGTFSQNGAPVRVEEAWAAMTSTSSRPIVAIIDTGVDYNHPIFSGSSSIWTNSNEIAGNGIDEDGNGLVDDVVGWNFVGRNSNPGDDEGHGTHVAGIVLGVSMDIFATLTTSPIRIMPLKFLGANGSGATSDAVSAVYYAVNQGARVINASWGGSSYSQALHDALSYAYSRGVVVVAAAGNYSSNNDQQPLYPSNLPVPSLVSVAASNSYDALAGFSNFGRSSVMLGSPGVSVLSTYPSNQYRSMSGTSMATPFAAGLAALAFREAPGLTGYQIRNILMTSVSSVSGLSGKVSTSGRLDALSVVQSAISQKNSAPYQPGYTPNAPAGARDPASVSASSSSGGGGSGGCGTVALLGPGAGGSGGFGSGGASGVSTGSDKWGVVLSLVVFPMLVWLVLQARLFTKPRRRHDRFKLKSEIEISVGGRQLVGQMQTISAGGLSFEAEALLEKGGVLSVKITSPDGKEQIEVEGCVVWSEKDHAYGVQFSEVSQGLRSRIGAWTKGLVRT